MRKPGLEAAPFDPASAPRPALARGSMDDPPSLPLGPPALDRVLGTGLLRGALHEVASAAAGDAPAATGFCAALAARALALEKRKPVIWVRHALATAEDGAPYGPGLAAFGLDPGRVLFVLAAGRREVLDAMEQALRSGTLAAVIGEMRGSGRLDLRASRRLSLAASRGATPGLLLRLGADRRSLAPPVSAATRWRIKTLASADASGVGAPRLQADLVRNRRGPPASFFLEWRTHDRTFSIVPPLRERVAPLPVGRPDPAPAPARLRTSA